MFRRLLVLALAVAGQPSLSQISMRQAKDRIDLVEYYGYEGIDLATLKRAMNVKAGQRPTDFTVDRVENDVRKVLGVDAADVSLGCCDSAGGYTVYVGLPGRSVRQFTYKDPPTEDLRLPQELLDLNDQLEVAITAAVNRGGTASQEDDSLGFALFGDPAARSLQLRLHDLAPKLEPEIFRVLRDSEKEDQRAVAATAIGYAARSARQVAALTDACRDSSDTVRNNATRALAVLLRADSTVAPQISPDLYIDMLSSAVWTDRNKAGLVLLELTRSREKEVLQQLRAKALVPLIEMAQWRNEGHSYFARILLGRIAGISEPELVEMATNKRAAEILRAVGFTGQNGKGSRAPSDTTPRQAPDK